MTHRRPNYKTEFQGVRFVQGVVQDNHSIFQNFSRENDQGNDCYIEFVQNELAINYGIFAQIKSGNSYKDNSGYKIVADQAHLQYWNNALHLTIGIVFDPEINKAFWVDITSYLWANPDVLLQHYHTIRVERDNEFSEATFDNFISYCLRFKDIFSDYEKYGRALEWFADVDRPKVCYEGLKSLYSNHRNKPATWFYIISNFSKISDEGIRGNILGLLSNYVNPNIFWHAKNIQHFPTKSSVEFLSELMTKYFRSKEVELVLPYLEEGISRGSFSYLVFLVIDMVKDLHILLQDIAFSNNLEEQRRNFCFWLYMNVAKFHSTEETLKVANKYFSEYPFAQNDEVLVGTRESIEHGDLWPIG